MDVRNDPNIVHETVLRDIVSMVSDFPIDPSKIAANLSSGNASKFSYKNIAKATRDLTLTFPVVVSDAVSVETASMISKAIERKATTMLQMLFSAIQITNADNAIDYLKKFHSNINADKNMSVDDWISFGNILGTFREDAGEDLKNITVDMLNESNPITYIKEDSAIKTAEKMAVSNSLPNVVMEGVEAYNADAISMNEQRLIAGVINSFHTYRDKFIEESYNHQSLDRFMVNTRFGYSVHEASQPVPKKPYAPDPNQPNTADKVLNKASAVNNAIANNKVVAGAGMASMALATPKAIVSGKNKLGEVVNKVNSIAGGSGNVMKTDSVGGKFVKGANKISNRITKTNLHQVIDRMPGVRGKLTSQIQAMRHSTSRPTQLAGKALYKAGRTNLNRIGKYGFIAGAAIGAGKLANSAYKNYKANHTIQQQGATREEYEFSDEDLNLKMVAESMAQELANEDPINEAQGGSFSRQLFDSAKASATKNPGSTARAISSALTAGFNAVQSYKNNKARQKMDAEKMNMDRAKNAIDSYEKISKTNLNNIEAYSKHIILTDVQKANEMIPTMMVVNFINKNVEGGSPINSSAAIGIKARLQYVSAADMADRIISKNEDHNGLFNFIKATTGQISFWKDFIFAIDKAKLDSVASSGKGSSSPVWKMLERRATMSRIRRWTGSVNDAAAITTLVISKDEVEFLKKTERIDLTRPNTVHTIMNAYNVMGFVIVDEVIEKADFLFDDGSSSYETVSFTHLERQGNGSDGAYKKMINLLVKKG